MIDGVLVKNLKVVPDERGRLMEMVRSDDPFFEKFGQVYMTTAYPGVIKAWHKHEKQTDHFTVIKGMAKVVLYDDRQGSETNGEVNEFFMGEHNPITVRIPKGVYHGFKNIGTDECIIVNCPDQVYNYSNPDELRKPAHTPDIPYQWERKDE
ncbi:MAG: dTDP-4-dehydrorhamnose 3,5-epimerase family protein [bacterium]